MEYRRRRKKTKSRRREREGGSALGALITLALIGAVVYAATSSKVLDWVDEKVAEPIRSVFVDDNEEDPGSAAFPVSGAADYVPGDAATNEAIDLSEGNAIPVSATVTLPAAECFMLQMGVFSSRENADALAQTLRQRGAAGYVLEDEGDTGIRYRVMAAGYEDEADARSVRERLCAEGNDCTLYTLSASEAEFRVSAPEGSIFGIETGFEGLNKAKIALSDAVITFDKEGKSIEEGKVNAQTILENLDADMSVLVGFAPDGAALSAMLDAYSKCASSIGALAEGEYKSAVDFSASMKYTYLYISEAYAALSSALAG